MKSSLTPPRPRKLKMAARRNRARVLPHRYRLMLGSVLVGSIEREILWRLVNGEQGAMVRQVALADSLGAQIGHAVCCSPSSSPHHSGSKNWCASQ
jgi:predicted Zn-dependent protease